MFQCLCVCVCVFKYATSCRRVLIIWLHHDHWIIVFKYRRLHHIHFIYVIILIKAHWHRHCVHQKKKEKNLPMIMAFRYWQLINLKTNKFLFQNKKLMTSFFSLMKSLCLFNFSEAIKFHSFMNVFLSLSSYPKIFGGHKNYFDILSIFFLHFKLYV